MVRALVVAIACALLCACQDDAAAGLQRALTGRGRVAYFGGPELAARAGAGTSLVDVAGLPELRAALLADDERAFAAALAAAHLQGIVVDVRGPSATAPKQSVARKLAGYRHLTGLAGVYLTPDAAFYALDPTHDWSPQLRAALAEVARRLLAGAPEPRLTSFPEAVRRVEPVEVMVLLRSGSRPRLWRSARGSSFARALLTAADVARKRWNERAQAMGGPLDPLLASLTVEVSLLQDDGELGVRDRGFIDRVVGPTHGIAYEQKGAWRYLLPEAVHTGKSGHASDAYERLFKDDGLPDGSLGSRELRLYRLAVRSIAVSEAPHARDAVFDVDSPSEVLDK